MSREIEQSSSAKQYEGNISRGLRESLLNRMGPKGDDKGEKRVLETRRHSRVGSQRK